MPEQETNHEYDEVCTDAAQELQVEPYGATHVVGDRLEAVWRFVCADRFIDEDHRKCREQDGQDNQTDLRRRGASPFRTLLWPHFQKPQTRRVASNQQRQESRYDEAPAR